MTPESLKAWRERMRWSKITAADALGLSPSGYTAYELGKPLAGHRKPRPIPKTVALACAAITHRLQPEE
jgi:adenine/guanine phosphoribosyltransferase-like PRPP-binding protein